MKKLISLILALALCLTAFSAFAETPSKQAVEALSVPAPTEVETELKDANGEQIVKVVADEEGNKASEDLLNTVVTANDGEALTLTYNFLEGLEEAQSVLCTPMPKITVNEEAVTAENEDTIVTIKSEIPAAASEYLKSFENLKAVYSYLKDDGYIYSIAIDFEVKEDAILYYIPLSVLADASGCASFINFVV